MPMKKSRKGLMLIFSFYKTLVRVVEEVLRIKTIIHSILQLFLNSSNIPMYATIHVVLLKENLSNNELNLNA